MGTVRAVAIYEWKMQMRRPALWIVLLIFALPIFARGDTNPWDIGRHTGALTVAAEWAYSLMLLLPVGYGICLADRVRRDAPLRDLLHSTGAAPELHLLGKYLGTALASAVPIALGYAAGLLVALVRFGDPGLIPAGVAAFALICLPGLLFVAAFSIVVPIWIPVPLYAPLLAGYWIWGNLLPASVGIPTLSGTVLTPLGAYVKTVLGGPSGATVAAATPTLAALSVALLLTGAALALLAGMRLPSAAIGTK